MNWIRERVSRWWQKKVRIWGTMFESERPAEFIITTHAEERMKERLNAPRKIWKQLIVGAFYSTQPVPLKWVEEKNGLPRDYKSKRNERVVYRLYMDYVWIFGCVYVPHYELEQKHLITMYPRKGF